jgi:hypothetical protein
MQKPPIEENRYSLVTTLALQWAQANYRFPSIEVRSHQICGVRAGKTGLVYRLRRHDGTYRWLLDDGAPRHNNQHEFVGYAGHCLDITEQSLNLAPPYVAIAQQTETRTLIIAPLPALAWWCLPGLQ